MVNIRPFIQTHLLAPLKQYPTKVQDTLMEIITQRLEELYDYTIKFPEIISPNQSRLDILKTIADQFLFTLREDADIEEQIQILDNILYVYSRRGSVDTIENMWKYYGGDLPKNVKVVIPSYKLFRYSMSRLSGDHVFPDNTTHRTGVYEIKLTNNTYPIPDLKEFLLNELVAAGNYIYFTNSIHSDILDSEDEYTNPYKYLVQSNDFLEIQMPVLKSNQGFTWSGHNPLSKNSEDSALSGRGSIFLELTYMIDMDMIRLLPEDDYIDILVAMSNPISEVRYSISIYPEYGHNYFIESFLYCTPEDDYVLIERDSYNSQEEIVDNQYPGYFVLNSTLLGASIQ